MEEILINREAKVCFNCNYRAKTAENSCPRCRKKLITEFEVQKKGIYNLLAGIFFTLIGLFVLAKYKLFSTGSASHLDFQTQIIGLLDFGLMMSWGVPMTTGGIWQYLTGKDGEIIGKPMSIGGLVLTGLATIYLFFLK